MIATSVLSVHDLKVTGNVSSRSFEEFRNFLWTLHGVYSVLFIFPCLFVLVIACICLLTTISILVINVWFVLIYVSDVLPMYVCMYVCSYCRSSLKCGMSY